MELNLGETPLDLDFHPSAPLVAAGLVNGYLHLYRYADDSQPERLLKIRAHKKKNSSRAVRFIDAGCAILTGSSDCSIVVTDVETGVAVKQVKKAHGDTVNRIVSLTENTVASGDDEGCIKIWDTRDWTCCNSFDAHEDYISDMTFVSDSMQLLGTSGDGTLSVCSLRKNKVQAQSEFSEDELLSIVTMKDGQKVICGTQTGALLLYSWGHFKDCSDRFLGHPMSVDALLKLDEDTLISGSEDGVVRLVSILPNKIIHPIAEHTDLPIQRLAFSSDRKFLGSISYDQVLKLWDLEDLLDGHQHSCSPSNQLDEMDVDEKPHKSSKGTKRSPARFRLQVLRHQVSLRIYSWYAQYMRLLPEHSEKRNFVKN